MKGAGFTLPLFIYTEMNNTISQITAVQIEGKTPSKITALALDSRKVISGSLFFAIRGTLTDGHKYIETAIENGAVAIVCQELPEKINYRVCYIVVIDSSLALSQAASAFYGDPSQSLTLVGITGTNGKTTIATLMHSLFTKLGYKVGLFSTVVNKIGEHESPSTHTTPDPIELNAMLREMVDFGCDYCFMEVSSHSIVQNRVAGLKFCGGVFTNLTHDHLDYHGTFSEYLKTKKSFFDTLPPNAFALTNIDDRNGEVMLQNCAARHLTYSLRTMSDYKCKIKEKYLDGMLLEINGTELWAQFFGRFNAYNLAAIYGIAIELGATSDEVLTAMSMLKPVVGRFDCVKSKQGTLAIVDYAHTPDALQNVLQTIAEFKENGKIYTVVGCGGDRDASKRPIMTRIAVELSDMTILTSDNPRTEDPMEILRQMQAGLDPIQIRKSLTIADRHQAIRTAVALAAPSDIILIAGKGHETYQQINDVKHHFDDKQEVEQAFENL